MKLVLVSPIAFPFNCSQRELWLTNMIDTTNNNVCVSKLEANVLN
jgi:hypothetical protein